jgi:hypothetical protein
VPHQLSQVRSNTENDPPPPPQNVPNGKRRNFHLVGASAGAHICVCRICFHYSVNHQIHTPSRKNIHPFTYFEALITPFHCYCSKLNVFYFAVHKLLSLQMALIKWVPGLSRQQKESWPQLEAGHLLPSRAEFKNGWNVTSIPIRLHGMVLKHRGKLTCLLMIAPFTMYAFCIKLVDLVEI